MMRARSLLLDTNVWLDYFLGTGPSIDDISRIVERGAEGAVELFYILPRRLRRACANGAQADEASFRSVAWACVEHMMELACAAPLSHAECQLARMLRGEFGDFEDDLILAAAETAKVDYIVTNDRALLRSVPEACVTPERACRLLL